MALRRDARARDAALAELSSGFADLSYVLRLDPDPCVEHVSDSVRGMLGYEPEALYADPRLGPWAPRFRDAAADDPAESEAVREFTARWGAADGQAVWVQCRERVMHRPDGSVAAYGVARDVTALHEAIDRMAAAEELTRTVMDNVTDVLLSFDAAGHVLWASQSLSTVLGWEPADIVGTVFRAWAPIDDGELDQEVVAAIAEGRDRFDTRLLARRRDDSRVWVDLTLRIVRGADGAVRHFVASVRDVTAEMEAQEALERERSYYQLLAENSSDIVVQIGPRGIIEWASPSVTGVLGWRPEEMVGRDPVAFVCPDDLEAYTAAIAEVAAGHDAPGRVRLLCADGTYRWLSRTARPMRDAAGAVVGRVSGFQDAQATVEAEEALAASQARYRMIAEHTADVIVHSVGGVVQWVSPSVESVLGWTVDELVGRTTVDLWHPDDVAAAVALRDRAYSGDLGRMELRLRHKDGSFRWVDTELRPTQEGTDASGLVATLRDVTDRVDAAAALARSEADFRLLAENASDVVVRLATDGRIRWVSPSVTEASGWQPAELVGLLASDLVHRDDRAAMVEAMRVVESGRPGRFDGRMRTSTGAYRHLSAAVRPVLDRDGRLVDLVAGIRDVTSETLVRRALVASERRFRQAMEAAPVGMAVLDLERRFVQVNPALCRMLDRDEGWLLRHGVPDVMLPDDLQADAELRDELRADRAPFGSREARLIAADGSTVWVEHEIALVRDEDGAPQSYVSEFVDITEARAVRERLEYLATHDSLTRLANRTELMTQMTASLAHHPRSGHRLAVLFCDLDGLKDINDRYGHAVGDRVLVAVAGRIRSQVRSTDTVARLGGDEFVVALQAVRDHGDATAMAEKINRAVARPVRIGEEEIRPTLSIGVAVADPGEDADTVLHRADTAVYRAKREGRDRAVAFDLARDGVRGDAS